jgi:hypothetical protein
MQTLVGGEVDGGEALLLVARPSFLNRFEELWEWPAPPFRIDLGSDQSQLQTWTFIRCTGATSAYSSSAAETKAVSALRGSSLAAAIDSTPSSMVSSRSVLCKSAATLAPVSAPPFRIDLGSDQFQLQTWTFIRCTGAAGVKSRRGHRFDAVFHGQLKECSL